MRGWTYLLGSMFGMWFAVGMLWGNTVAALATTGLLVGGWLLVASREEG